MSGPYQFDDLLATKLEIPLVGSRIVPRRRLTDMLKAGMERRLTLMVAPTGYGKTTLLVEWLSGMMLPDWRLIWLTVDSFDNEPFRLWSYVASAIKKVYPRLRFDPQRFFNGQQERSRLESLTPLLNAITQAPYQLVLILDDYQWITSEQVHEEIRYLLDHQPKNLHLLISSRVTPPFPLARLRAQRQLIELTAEDLSFTLSEARHFFSSSMDMEIDQDQAASLVNATEGWIAGLQLATLSLQGQPDRKSFIASLPDESYEIFEYLTEEVLDQQPPELRDFLLKTSILSEFSAPLCDAMLGRKDSLEMLSRIQQANLFMVPRDEQRYWYSYHRLFADTLRKYLRDTQPDILPDLHRRACDWLQDNGYPEKAVTHALAYGDVEQAAKIIDACALQAVIGFDLVQLAQWIGRFSDELISERPQLGIYDALANFLLERFDKVEPKLLALEQLLRTSREDPLKPEDEKLILWEIAAIRACLNYWQENSADNLSKFAALMQDPPKSDVYFYGLMLHGLAEVYASRGNLEAAVEAYSKGCQFAIDYHLVREYCYSQSELAYVRKTQGRLRAADRDYQNLLDYALRFGLPEDVVAFAKTGMAEIALEQGRMDQADELIGWVIENYDRIESSPLNWIRQEWLYVRLAQYHLTRKVLPGALVFFEKAMSGFRANRQVVHYLSSELIDLQVKIWQATGELGAAELKIQERLDYLDVSGKSGAAAQAALARRDLALGDCDKALQRLDQLIQDLRKTGMKEPLVEALVLKTLALRASGDSPSALQTLRLALEYAIDEGYQQVFTQEGSPMEDLLLDYLHQNVDGSAGIRAAVESMIGSFRAGENTVRPLLHMASAQIQSTTDLVYPMAEPFSRRELGILKLIADGKSTKEIAAALMISINTTKVHIKSIYRKTGTHTRPALLQRVEELGLL